MDKRAAAAGLMVRPKRPGCSVWTDPWWGGRIAAALSGRPLLIVLEVSGTHDYIRILAPGGLVGWVNPLLVDDL